ncbi:MAG TPA: 23S rRNA (pseudouridine(1915)-N(3))-methyltransferase RlmH [Candidatus Magasanikbacteria bacterium]|nr:23S rRNA (pseudouridine(1915)-N(3))-methyltransferase RlmH [Candidatus Magasanikbacteria bacterium]
MKINIIVVGKYKEKYWLLAENEYLKRLSAWFKINIIELKEESFSEKEDREKIKIKEAQNILAKIPDNSFVVALDENGTEFTSEKFADKLKSWTESGDDITFILGGPLGLHETVLQKAKFKLALSQFTFTHQMARVFLLEQLYRGKMINQNRKYHY